MIRLCQNVKKKKQMISMLFTDKRQTSSDANSTLILRGGPFMPFFLFLVLFYWFTQIAQEFILNQSK